MEFSGGKIPLAHFPGESSSEGMPTVLITYIGLLVVWLFFGLVTALLLQLDIGQGAPSASMIGYAMLGVLIPIVAVWFLIQAHIWSKGIVLLTTIALPVSLASPVVSLPDRWALAGALTWLAWSVGILVFSRGLKAYFKSLAGRPLTEEELAALSPGPFLQRCFRFYQRATDAADLILGFAIVGVFVVPLLIGVVWIVANLLFY